MYLKMKKINYQDSVRIDIVKIVLCLGIILRHSLMDIDIDKMPISCCINSTIELITYSFVPCFFVISGFLFFANVDRNKLVFGVFLKKITSRINSLLIPYIVANLFALCVLFCISYLGIESKSLPKLTTNFGTIILGFWDTGSGSPYGYGLWFLRDLFVVSFLSPLIYIYVNKLKALGIIILIVCWLLNIVNIPLSGIGLSSITFFGLGTYLSIVRNNLFLLAPKKIGFFGQAGGVK